MQTCSTNHVGLALSLLLSAAAFAQPCADRWAPGMGAPGTDGTLTSLRKWDPDGSGPLAPVIVLAGGFTVAGATLASSIATWDGARMSVLGSGIAGYVMALEVDRDGNLIAAGGFNMAGGVTARNIARWDGASWSEFGGGTDSYVQALARDVDGNIVAGGDFLHAGGANHTHVARWTAGGWEQMGFGIPGAVVSLARGPGNTVVAVAHPANSSAINVAWNWTGAQWIDITAPNVQSLTGVATLPNGDVMMVGPVAASPDTIRRWNGTSYVSMGLNSNLQVGRPQVLEDGSIYVLNVRATSPSGNVIRGVAQYINNDWIEAAHITSGPAAVEKLHGQMLLGGNLYGLEGEYHWDSFVVGSGTSWNMPPFGFDHYAQQSVTALSDGRMLVSGYFTIVNGVPARRIAMLSGSTWSAMGAGFNDLPRAMVQMPDGSLVAGGLFTASDTTPVLRVARWNGTAWAPMGAGFNGDVNALALAPNGTLYAGGSFTLSGGASINRVARWNGTAWLPLGDGVDGPVLSLAVQPDGTLLAGGQFFTAGSQPASRIAAWSGFGWSALGSGCDGFVNSILVTPAGEVIIGGGFSSAGDVPASCVAKWDGVWSPLGGGLFGGQVNAMTLDANGQIIAAGTFQSTAGRQLPSIARFDGTQWLPLGSTISGGIGSTASINGIARLADGRIAVSGDFAALSGTLSRGLAFFGPGLAPAIGTEPVSLTVCRAAPVQFHVAAFDGPGTQFRWRKDGTDISLITNPSAGTDTLRIAHAAAADVGEYSCRVSNDCGETLSHNATLVLCASDFNCDGIADFFDYLDFVAAFAVGDARADFNGDGAIDFFDYLDFVAAFAEGC